MFVPFPAVPWAPRAGYAALLAPIVAAAIALPTGNIAASVFALTAGFLWLLVTWLPRAIQGNAASIRWLRWTPALVVALAAASLLALMRDPTSAKFIYSLMTLACLIAGLRWTIPRWTSLASTALQIIPQIVVSAAIFVWLIYSESDWYVTPFTAMGIPHTRPYLTFLPAWWWMLCIAIPAAALVWNARRQQTTQHQQALFDERPKRALYIAAFIVIVLMALLQTWDFIYPRLGLQIFEGDEYGYLVTAYQLLEHGVFNPPHMPLISLYLAMILAVAGDSTTAIVLTNAAVLILTVALLMYALWLISSDMRTVLLGGLLIVSQRTLYLNVWTPLTETLNTMLWAAALVGLLAAIRRPTWAAHAGFGAVIGLLLLTRSQNLGGVLGLGVVYLGLLIFVPANRRAAPVRRSLMLIGVLLIATTLPLFAWGEYRQASIGKFQVMDGRGAEIFLGMNTPGIEYGFAPNVWESNVASWKARHPDASSAGMMLAGIRFRIENPAETLAYAWQRTRTFFNFHFPLLEKDISYWTVFKANQQLIIAVVAAIALLFASARWLGIAIWTIFISFASIFIAVYVEPRYRLPMDPYLTIGATVFFAQVLFNGSAPAPARRLSLARHAPAVRLFILLLVAAVLTVVGMRIAEVARSSENSAKFIAADLHPEGATFVANPAFDVAAYQTLPTWADLIKTDDLRSLEGKLFRAHFRLVGHLFRAGSLNRYSKLGLPIEYLQRVEATDGSNGTDIASSRMSVSFKGALVEEGIKERGEIDLVGRVRTVKQHSDRGARDFVYVIIDALYVNCTERPSRQQCKR